MTEKTIVDYLNTVDPDTNKPYDIPMLNVTDPDYAKKYVDFVKKIEFNPQLKQSLLNWD